VRWERALEAVQSGLAGRPTDNLMNNLRATQLLLMSYLENAPPSTDLLYRAGLSALAVQARAGADIEQLLTESVLEAA
jgi:hypothetical protein